MAARCARAAGQSPPHPVGVDRSAARPVHRGISRGNAGARLRRRAKPRLRPALRAGDPAAVRAMLPELLAIPADLIVSSGPAIQAMRAATGKPVLFAISGDPVALGIAQSLARPGRNFTGSTFLSLEVAQKRVQLLRELLPGLRTLAILSNTNHPGEPSEHEATQKRPPRPLASTSPMCPSRPGWNSMRALERVRAAGADAMLVFPDGVTMVHRAKIAEFARRIGCRRCSAGASTATPVGWRATARTSGRPMSGWPPMPIGSCAGRTPGPADRAADRVRAGDQPQDRAGARHRDPARRCSPVPTR